MGANGLWVLHPGVPSEVVQLASVDLQPSTEAMRADLEPREAGAGPA